MEKKLNLLIKSAILILTLLIIILLIFQLKDKYETYYEAQHFEDGSESEMIFTEHCLYHRGIQHIVQSYIGNNTSAPVTYCQIGSKRFIWNAPKDTVDGAAKVIK
jgi:hypothetical protein